MKSEQALLARWQEVKAKPGKVTVSSKAKSPTVKAKPAAKKTVTKPATKAKATTKTKPAAKAKPAAGKTAIKTAVKSGKAVASKKAVAKPAAKKTTPKASPKTAAKPAVKQPSAKRPAAKAPAAKTKAQQKAVEKSPAKASAPAPVTPPAAPVRTARASSRLAQLTVPSMAQSVASTAVKASYTPTMTQTLIDPPTPTAVKKDPKLANNWKTKSGEALTDEELMAMPDSEYMNDKQLAAFRLRLQRLKEDILANAGETTEHLREETVVVPDPADRATIEEEHALELRTRDRERKLLKKIEQSIDLIDGGEYGYCDETGEPIGVGRLLARPTATLSLEAQQRRELKQKMFGD